MPAQVESHVVKHGTLTEPAKPAAPAPGPPPKPPAPPAPPFLAVSEPPVMVTVASHAKSANELPPPEPPPPPEAPPPPQPGPPAEPHCIVKSGVKLQLPSGSMLQEPHATQVGPKAGAVPAFPFPPLPPPPPGSEP